SSMSVAADVPDALGDADGAGLPPPMLTGCADPMLVPGAITATSAASVMYIPADAARAPEGETNTTTGTFAAIVRWMMSRIEVSRPPGVSMVMISAVACPLTARSIALPM